MIKIEKTSKRKFNTLEMKVMVLLEQVKFYAEDLDSFKRIFDEDLKKMKRPNTNIPHLTYKCLPGQKIIGDPPCLEIWHVSPTGYHDRCIAKIFNEQ